MRFILSLTTILLMATSCLAQGRRVKGNGNRIEQTRKAEAYTGVRVSGGLDIEISDRQTGGIIVVADENMLDYIETEVESGTLRVKMKKGHQYLFNGKSPKVIVPNTGLIKDISASGGSDVYTDKTTLRGAELSINCSGGSDFSGDIHVGKLDVVMSGGSDFKGTVEADVCHFNLSGGSDMAISGNAEICNASISGGSDMDAAGFTVKKYDFSASGGSDADINCSEALNVSAGGGSDITYKGNCTVVSSIGRSSSLRKR